MTTEKKVPLWFSLSFALIGAYIVLLSLGVFPDSPLKKQALFDTPRHWQVTSFGLAFFCAGISVAFAERRHWLLVVNGAVLLAAFFAPVTWVLFFSGAVSPSMQILGGIPLVAGAVGGLLGLLRLARGG